MNLFYDLPLEIQDKILINIKYDNKEKYYKKCKKWLNKSILEITECFAENNYQSILEMANMKSINNTYDTFLIEMYAKENYNKVLLELIEFF